MITTLLGDAAEVARAGGLVRERPAPQVLRDLAAERRGPRPSGQAPMRVLLVDDAVDIRAIMRINLELSGAVIVGEAGTGREAVELASELQPDVVLLDLAMPGMDGLEALPLVRAAAPDAKVVVLSGFAAARMEQSALDLGAAAYVEKGTPVHEILELLRRLCPDKDSERWAGPMFAAVASTGAVGDAARAFMEELRTPLTVVTGLVDTIREQGDRLPSATVAELWATLARNVTHLTTLLVAYDDTTGGGQVPAPRSSARAKESADQ
ncbi:MAG TPA: response regulator, partial [Mycobacteriales bacterium]|nr:response regulator [Mycobacteriales bacterium]